MTHLKSVAAMLLAIASLVWSAPGAMAEAAMPSVHDMRTAEAPAFPRAPTRDELVGVWETRNVELGQDVAIAWIVRPDGTLGYEFVVDGRAAAGPSGTWQVDAAGGLTERWPRSDGTAGLGRARLELIDKDTLRLTIIENGHAEYTGKVRIYRRRGAPKLSHLAG